MLGPAPENPKIWGMDLGLKRCNLLLALLLSSIRLWLGRRRHGLGLRVCGREGALSTARAVQSYVQAFWRSFASPTQPL